MLKIGWETRKIRNFAAALTLISGVTHIAQLWFVELDGPTLFSAMLGIFYCLLGLGLAGRSRLSLWLGLIIPIIGLFASAFRFSLGLSAGIAYIHIAGDLLLFSLCALIIYRMLYVQAD